MFDVFCDRCRRRQLLTVSRVRGMHNTARGIAVEYECWCGEASVWLTGRRAGGAPVQ